MQLPIDPMILRLTWRSSDGDKPVKITIAWNEVDGGFWRGEIRIDGYPAKMPVMEMPAVDWIQALQIPGQFGVPFLLAQFKGAELYWAGTTVRFEFPQWRQQRRRGLLERLFDWWS